MSTNTKNSGPFTQLFVGLIFCVVGFIFFNFFAADAMKFGKSLLIGHILKVKL